MNVLKKAAKKAENSKIVKDPKFLLIGLIIIVVVITLIYFIFLKYSPIMDFKYEGYAISGKEITENLLGSSAENDSSTSKNIELTKIEEQGTIFKKLNDYFVGNKEKTEINLNYPIYINGNSSLYNLSEGSTLISKDFEEVSGYPNLSISEGKIYDGNNLERADAKEYIFVKTTDNIYINLYEIKVKTTANEYTIPVNSIIAFTENAIRYYSVNNNVLVFNQINDIDNNSNMEMVENGYTYKELLTRLRILQEESNNTENSNMQENIIQENTTNEEVTNDNTNNENEQQNTDNNTTDQNGYIKPEVRAENFTAEVYTAKSTLYIKDPVGRIVEAPTFEIYKDGKIYLRRTFSNSGEIQIIGLIPDTEYEVIGKYIYLNGNNQKVENTFYEGKFTTKGYEELGSIDIQKEKGEIFSNKIQLIKVKIMSDLSAEVIKGINQVEIETGEIRTVLKNTQVNELLQGKEITIESSEGLKSDSKINYMIKFYDKNGIELKVNNNEGETRTSKEAPTVRVSLKKQDIVNVTLGLKLTNRDNVELENYKYVVTRPNGEVVQEKILSENETELLLEDLDQNQYYKISIYADYDLNNNKGKQEQVEIGNLVFATQPISTLGSLELTVENKEITSTTSTISYKINEDRTDKRLIQILNELTINIVEQPANNEENNDNSTNEVNANNKDKKDGTVVYTDILSGEEIENLQQAITKEIKYENLKSNTTYTIEITGNVQLGNTQETIPITYSYKEFITLKIPAKVEIKNQFVTGNLIDFDIRIEDIDNSVLNNTVRMELRNSSNDLIDLQELTTNEDFIRNTYEKLEENQTYRLSFYADQYNEGSTDETYKVNYLIKEIEIITEPGISGKIGLTELSKKATGKNLVDMSSEIKWYVYPTFNTGEYYGKEYDEKTKVLKLGGHNNYRRAVYDLREYAGQEVTMSFKAKAVSDSQTAYIQNSKIDANRTKIDGLTTDWKDFQYTLTIDSTGYLGFYISGGNGIEIQELQIELGKQKTSYEEFKYILQSNYNINLEDKRDEITTNDYYIKVYEDNTLIKTDRYEEIPTENIITNAIKTYETQSGKQYKVQLIIKIKDREYVLSELEYNTQDAEEIKGIYNKNDFLEIQPKGNYIVLNDINIAGSTEYFFGNQISFEGTIDFNGKKLDRFFQNASLFSVLSETANIRNLVLNVYLPNVGVEFYGKGALFKLNYGTIENVQCNLVETYEQDYTHLSWIGVLNRGVIDKIIVNYKTKLISTSNTSAIEQNFGIIRNGYVYGENIEIKKGNDYISPFIQRNMVSGTLENIFVLNSTSNQKITGIYEANILGRNEGKVKNIYSVNLNGESTVLRGPNIYSNIGSVENSYYFSDKIYNNTDIKTSELALYDINFQNQLLNSYGSFNVEEYIDKGYFPQLNMPECMPAQIYISLPKVEDKDLIDITSVEAIEQTNNTAKLKITLNNPNAETIKNIAIQNLKCEILEQEYNNSKSEVIVYVSNPIRYVSEYEFVSVTSQGAWGSEYTKKYEANERKFYIDFYKEINNIDDWCNINKSLTENYVLTTDLDFMNQSSNIIIKSTYSGKLNGNNHIIKNINVPNNYAGVFIALTGSIENLIIENYKQEISNSIYNGFIKQSTTNSHINNVHMRNANITQNTEKEICVGGLIGCTDSNSNIENSSVINSKININNYIESVSIGGIIGYNVNAVIKNCFVNNIEINIENALMSQGIGGIAGRSNGGAVQNCYTNGIINSNREYVGGIVGYSTKEISNCYSLMQINTTANFTSGIVGYVNFSAGDYKNENPIKYNLYLGDIYTEGEITNRISGNASLGKGNYGYKEQQISGPIIGSEDVDLLDYNSLLIETTYTNKLLWEDGYDYSELSQGVFPKLKHTLTGEILIDQEDQLFEEAELKIINKELNKENSNTVQIRLEIKNEQGKDIKKIEIEDMDSIIIRNVYESGISYLDITATPVKYLDCYKISKIYYGENEEQKLSEKLEIQFFKEISSYSDWQGIDKTSAQNYKLMSDIDLNGRNEINSNISIGRLDGNGFAIKNAIVLIEESGGLIKELKKEMYNITFENINITCNNSGNYLGIIGNNSGRLNNVTFKNITINAPNRNYVACIAKNNAEYIDNVLLEEINIVGNSYVGSLIGNTYEQNITNINANNITIKGNGHYVGGIIGQLSWSDYMQYPNTKDINIDTATVVGNNYVGGVYGYGRAYYIQARGVKVNGENYVGGISGYVYYKNGWSDIYDSEINGTGNNIGGITGWHDWLQYCNVINCKIKGIGANSSNVGGVCGYSNQRSEYCSIADSVIEANGNGIGGISGNHSGAQFSYVYNTEITGYSNVGGIMGEQVIGLSTTEQCYVNAKIYAISNNVGGLVGYANNLNATDSRTFRITNSAVYRTTIEGKNNVGGITGSIAEQPQNKNWYYRNYVEAKVYGDENSTSLGIGSNKQYNSLLEDIYIYKYSTINNEFPNIQNEIFITENAYLVENDLKETETYTSKLKWSTSNWNINAINKDKYPTLKSSSLPEQEGIDLPKDEEHINNIIEFSLDTENEEMEESFEYTNKIIETYSTYSVITSSDGSNATRNAKLYVKDNNLYAIPVKLNSDLGSDSEEVIPVANNLILDSYNGKEYETVLGSDGKLYELKEPIKYPENFVNENIESIGNNLTSDAKEIEVTYKNGDKIKFNYQTGEVISSSESDTSDGVGLFDYLVDKISEIGNSNSDVSQEIAVKYEESKELQTKLEKTSVEEAIEKQNSNSSNTISSEEGIITTDNNENNNSLKENKYISMYNEETGEYEIYNEEELLDTNKEEVVSENEKIEANNLSEYYASEGETRSTKMGIVWIVISIIGVGIILFILKRNLKKKA